MQINKYNTKGVRNRSFMERLAIYFKFNGKARIEFYEFLSEMSVINSIDDSLELKYKEYSNDYKNPDKSLAIVVRKWRDEYKQGLSLAESMRPYIPNYEYRMIMAGEESNIAVTLEKAAKLTVLLQRVKSATFGLILSAGNATVILLVYLSLCAFKLIPSLLDGMDPSLITGAAGIFVEFCMLFQVLIMPIAVLIFVAIVWLYWALPNWTSKYRITADNWPVFKTYRDKEAIAFLIAFNEISKVKMDKEALAQIRIGATPWLKQRIDKVLQLMIEGRSFAYSLKESGYNFPSPDVIKKLVIYDNKKSNDLLDKHIERWQVTLIERLEKSIDFYAKLSQIIIAVIGGLSLAATAGISHQIMALH